MTPVDDTPHSPPWWHPIRSRVVRPRWWQQALAIVLSLFATLLSGIAMSTASSVLGSGDAALYLSFIGFAVTFAPMASWMGHLGGAVVLHLLLTRGLGGWLVTGFAGWVVGMVLTLPFGFFATLFGPVLAVLQLGFLRALTMETRTAGA